MKTREEKSEIIFKWFKVIAYLAVFIYAYIVLVSYEDFFPEINK